MSGLDSRSHVLNTITAELSKNGFASADCATNGFAAVERSYSGQGSGASGVNSQKNLVTSLRSFFTGWRRKNMVYVQRDAQGRLLRVEYQPFEGMSENLAVESEELQNWLRVKEEVKARLDALNSSDLELIRVLEDVVIVLVDRGVIQYTDLPEAARSKLDERAIARADMEGLNSMLKESGE